MSHRPLVFVSGLTIGDYLLWTWSVNANHEVISLLAGLTLLPLLLATLALLLLHGVRALADRARRRASQSAAGQTVPARAARPSRPAVATQHQLTQAPGSAKASAQTRSRRIAA